MMSEQNKQILRKTFEELLVRGNLSGIDDYIASDFVGHDNSGGIFGRDEFRMGVAEVIDAFSDRNVSIEDQLVEGDKVVTRWKLTAMHTGPIRGMGPTGLPVAMMGISIDRIAGGKVVESWEVTDEAGVMRQLGVMPSPVEAGG